MSIKTRIIPVDHRADCKTIWVTSGNALNSSHSIHTTLGVGVSVYVIHSTHTHTFFGCRCECVSNSNSIHTYFFGCRCKCVFNSYITYTNTHLGRCVCVCHICTIVVICITTIALLIESNTAKNVRL